MENLTDKQNRFVAEYLVDLNATQAAIRAGYSKKTAYSTGQRLLKHAEVQATIQKRQEKIKNKLEITQEKVLEELAAIAFSNGTDYANVADSGMVKIIPTDDLSDEKRKAVASIKAGPYGTEVKTHDKVRALEMLGKYLGMLDGKSAADDEGVKIIDDV